MIKPYILVSLIALLAAIGYFVLGIVELTAKDSGRVLGINIGIIDILAGVIALGVLLIAYNVLKKEK